MEGISDMNRTCAVIIAACNCPEYIMDCVKSVKKSIQLDGWNYDIRIGVDGCRATSNVLKKNKISHYYSIKNVGAYIMRNSLIYLKKADVYAYFDADDVMSEDYLKRSLEEIENGHHAVMTAKLQCDENMKIKAGGCATIESGGAITFTHHALEQVGGFYRYRCACDTDFMYRLEMAGIKIAKIYNPLYYRRRHNKSLTRSGNTRYGSKYRNESWAEMNKKREAGIIKIKPTVIKLKVVR